MTTKTIVGDIFQTFFCLVILKIKLQLFQTSMSLKSSINCAYIDYFKKNISRTTYSIENDDNACRTIRMN